MRYSQHHIPLLGMCARSRRLVSHNPPMLDHAVWKRAPVAVGLGRYSVASAMRFEHEWFVGDACGHWWRRRGAQRAMKLCDRAA